MKERRCFAPAQCWQAGQIVLGPDQSHHLMHVLRRSVGDSVVCFDESGRCAQTIIADSAGGRCVLTITTDILASAETSIHITLAQAVIKSHRMDFIFQKTVELGIDRVIPFFSKNCVVSVADTSRREHKRERWQKIAVEAAKQSGGCTVPEITSFVSLNDLIATFDQYDTVLIGHHTASPVKLSQNIDAGANVMLVIGPEGGLTDDELGKCTAQANCLPWRFAKSVLRAETAALSAVAILRYLTDLQQEAL